MTVEEDYCQSVAPTWRLQEKKQEPVGTVTILSQLSLLKRDWMTESLFGNSVLDPAMQQEAAHGQIDKGFGGLRLAFVIATQTARAAQPAEGAFAPQRRGSTMKPRALTL